IVTTPKRPRSRSLETAVADRMNRDRLAAATGRTTDRHKDITQLPAMAAAVSRARQLADGDPARDGLLSDDMRATVRLLRQRDQRAAERRAAADEQLRDGARRRRDTVLEEFRRAAYRPTAAG
ncbi:MAG: hypothetical protein ACODAE_11515, partial [Gemmatimonadota bacterium]